MLLLDRRPLQFTVSKGQCTLPNTHTHFEIKTKASHRCQENGDKDREREGGRLVYYRCDEAQQWIKNQNPLGRKKGLGTWGEREGEIEGVKETMKCYWVNQASSRPIPGEQYVVLREHPDPWLFAWPGLSSSRNPASLSGKSSQFKSCLTYL